MFFSVIFNNSNWIVVDTHIVNLIAKKHWAESIFILDLKPEMHVKNDHLKKLLKLTVDLRVERF